MQFEKIIAVYSKHYMISVETPIHPSNGATAQIGPWPPPLRFLNHTELDTVGLLWTSDQPVAETTYTGQHNI
jgi:hypothetical protein